MSIYIFTDAKCSKVLDVKIFDGTVEDSPADKAAKHRKKLGKDVVAWAHMGKDNPQPTWPKK